MERIKTITSIILIAILILILISHTIRGFIIIEKAEVILTIIIIVIFSYIFFATYYKNKLRVHLIFQIIKDFAFQDQYIEEANSNIDRIIRINLDKLIYILNLGYYKNFFRKLLKFGPQMAFILMPKNSEFKIIYSSTEGEEVYKNVIENFSIPKVNRDELKVILDEYLSKIKRRKIEKKFHIKKSMKLSLTVYVYEFETIKVVQNVKKSIWWSFHYEDLLPPDKKRSYKSRSAIGVPLIYKKKKLGVLIVCDTISYNYYRTDKIFLAAYAHLISKYLYSRFSKKNLAK